MIKKVTVLQTHLKEIQTAKGPAQKFGIKFMQDGKEVWASTFLSQFNKDGLTKIIEGQTIDIVTWTKGEFVNFRLPSQLDRLEARVEILEKGTDRVSTTAYEPGINNPDPDDIPF